MDLIIEHKRAWVRQSRYDWTQFSRRTGVGPGQFADRLARARLLFLRRRDVTANWLALALLLGLFPAMFLPSQARAGVYDEVRAGSLLWREADSGALKPAMRVDTRIEARVSGMIARVTVRQTFRNDSAEWMHGVYVFPLAEKAAVDRLKMHIGERFIVGEIREREAARQVFEQARQSGRQASLVEQERPNLFTTSVANVPPGAAVEVEIGYLESLDYSGEEWRMRIPLTLTPRYVPGGTESPPPDSPVDPGSDQSQRASISVSIDAGVRLDAIRSSYHAVSTTESEGAYKIVLQGNAVPADRDFELVWRPRIGGVPAAAVFTEQYGEETYALLMFLPPHEEPAGQRAAREVIYIIDTSGSMHGPSIRQAKEALLLALSRLDPRDTFNVIQFNSVTETLFPAPRPASPDNGAAAREYVQSLEADGGTQMLPALQAAFAMPASQGRLRQVVFITDGAVGNEDQLLALIRGSLGERRLFTVGIGAAPNGYFMRSAAEAGRGTFTYIGSPELVQQRMAELFRKIESPALTGVEVQWPAGAKAEMAMSKVPDLYYGEPVVVTARLQGEASGLLTLTGRSGSGHWIRQATLGGARPNEGIAALWARNRIEDLLARRHGGGNADDIRAQVLELALAHRLVSPYTSLVAVDRTPVRPAEMPAGTTAIPNTAPAGSAWSASAGYPATATDSRWHLLIGCALLLLGFAMSGRPRRATI